MKYIIRDREAGNEIARFDALEEAQTELAAYEEEDRKDGTFTEDFYELVEKQTVENSYGTEIYYEQAVIYMDDDLREELHRELAPCTEQEFFTAYAKAHFERFGEVWVCDEPNPTI